MAIPEPDDYIDIHNHNVTYEKGLFSVDNIMAHEERIPVGTSGIAYSTGIHPWFLDDTTFEAMIGKVRIASEYEYVIAIGEAGFDRLKGPYPELQRKAFEAQVEISETSGKPLVIHNVKGLDDLLAVHKKIKPEVAWIIHGFKGKKEMADQLLSRGIYLSLWTDFAMNPASASLIRYLPTERLFLETDGFDTDIRDIYMKVSDDLDITVSELKKIIFKNYLTVFAGR